jgi:hypothetical protein
MIHDDRFALKNNLDQRDALRGYVSPLQFVHPDKHLDIIAYTRPDVDRPMCDAALAMLTDALFELPSRFA